MKYFVATLTGFLLIIGFQNCGSQFHGKLGANSTGNYIPQGYVQIDDMLVTEESVRFIDSEGSKEEVLSSKTSVQRGLKEVGINLWPNGDLYYRFHSSVSEKQKKRFIKACKQLGKFAPVRCIETEGSRNHVLVQTLLDSQTSFCGQAALGYKAEKGQPLYMNETCWELPQIIEHELMHAFGISHEHIRPEANEYVTFLEVNGLGDYTGTTGYVIPRYSVDYLTSKFDYESIMHYNSYLYEKKIMWKKDFSVDDPSGEIKYANYMSIRDHRTLYELYKNSSNSKTWPTWNLYSEYFKSTPVIFEVNCDSGAKNRLSCVSLNGPITNYDVLWANGCNFKKKIGQSGSKKVYVEKGCKAKIRVKTNARFANSFQIEGVFKYSKKEVLKRF